MIRERFSIPMEKFTMAKSRILKSMEKAICFFKITVNLLENSRMDRSWAMELFMSTDNLLAQVIGLTDS